MSTQTSATIDGAIRVLREFEVPDLTTSPQRATLLEAAKGLIRRLETPSERILYLGLLPFTFAAEKTLMEANLFKLWFEIVEADENQGNPQKDMRVDDLAKLIDADEVLVERLLRLLASEERVDRPSHLTYRMNDYTRQLARAEVVGFHDFCQVVFHPAAGNMPKYLAGLGYKNPEDPLNTSFIQTTEEGIGMHLFPWLTARPSLAESFAYTVPFTAQQFWWLDVFPVKNILPSTKPTKDEITIVDVGGGLGRDLERFSQEHGNKSARLVLQDLEHVLESAQVGPKIEKMVYDFFTPQPVIGARVYSLRNVLHDWPMEKAAEILRNQRSALVDDRSQIFIHERIIPDANISMGVASLDMIMMTLGSAIERNWAQWQEVIRLADLRVVRTWEMPSEAEFIIVCEK